eukprot:7675314-Heterocapsa_arctica.AAC.1
MSSLRPGVHSAPKCRLGVQVIGSDPTVLKSQGRMRPQPQRDPPEDCRAQRRPRRRKRSRGG